ncbi:MAG TPA: hypothetical protein VHZ06_01980 [Marmoricola sp.]|jgi:hypothetical protein|nr:hypothetical protein [Marmoricola sp.]
METQDMDTAQITDVLMLHGETRHCSDCATATVFLPVEDQGWVCTVCDGAVLVQSPFAA